MRPRRSARYARSHRGFIGPLIPELDPLHALPRVRATGKEAYGQALLHP
ncbi:hypothetical protein HMPREF1549_01355 [Actinomyces johnsonii F0510]|uniref:Uncharacterized protein n=1 Tax=Actinomyces johnsonii F0510 TaxID=1227262 RepID=U1QDC9_9ACTO|nr:hypothetical protein HMPREF1549_01355 [Actinomyces johnsonii F0510]